MKNTPNRTRAEVGSIDAGTRGAGAAPGLAASPAWKPRALFVAVLLAMTFDAQALGFGEVRLTSQLGERLHARVPIVGGGAHAVASDCVRLIPESALHDAPLLTSARAVIDRASQPPAVVVTTPGPVHEPAVRFILELGCTDRYRREFVLLIDPPELAAGASDAPARADTSVAHAIPEEPRWPTAFVSPDPKPIVGLTQPASEPPPAAVSGASERTVTPAPRATERTAAKPAARQGAQAAAAKSKPRATNVAPRAATVAAAPKDRLVLADVDPVRTGDPAKEAKEIQEAAERVAREQALQRQLETLANEVTRMRVDMEKLSARNRELEETRGQSGWLAAGGLAMVLLGIGIGSLGRRQGGSWLDSLRLSRRPRTAGAAAWASDTAMSTEREAPAPARAATAAVIASRIPTLPPEVEVDLDVTKLDVREEERAAVRQAPTSPDEVARSAAAMWENTDFSLGRFQRAPGAVAPDTPEGEMPSLDFSLETGVFDTDQENGVLPMNRKLLPPSFSTELPVLAGNDSTGWNKDDLFANTIPLNEEQLERMEKSSKAG
jgi:hypothetical protein